MQGTLQTTTDGVVAANDHGSGLRPPRLTNGQDTLVEGGQPDRHYERIRTNPETTLLSIDDDGVFAGTIGSYTMDGERGVTYWIDPSRWGRGIASAALRTFLGIEVARPLFARVAAHNLGSATVLERAGLVRNGTETSYADGVGREVVERIYRLTAQ